MIELMKYLTNRSHQNWTDKPFYIFFKENTSLTLKQTPLIHHARHAAFIVSSLRIALVFSAPKDKNFHISIRPNPQIKLIQKSINFNFSLAYAFQEYTSSYIQNKQIAAFSYACYNNQIESSSSNFVKAMFNFIDYSLMAPFLCPTQPIMFPSSYFFNFTVNSQPLNQCIFYVKNQNVSTENEAPQQQAEGNLDSTPKLKASGQPLLSTSVQKQKKVTYAESLMKSVTNRNILPNNLNLITSFLRRINKSGNLVRRIIKKYSNSPRYTPKHFYAYQAYLKQNLTLLRSKHSLVHLTTHINPNITCFTVDEQLFYNKVCRILINAYLSNEFLINLLASTKIQKTSKAHHMKVQRYLLLRFKLQGASSDQDIHEDNDCF